MIVESNVICASHPCFGVVVSGPGVFTYVLLIRIRTYVHTSVSYM